MKSYTKKRARMTTFESLKHIVENLSSHERKFIRRYLDAFKPEKRSVNKSRQLLESLLSSTSFHLTAVELQKQLYGRRHPTAFDRLVTQLRKRIIEALSLPIAGSGKLTERVAAELRYHREYIKALILFESGDYESADATLLGLLAHTNKFEMYAEQIAVVDFLINTISIYGNAEVIPRLKNIPRASIRLLSLISSGEATRELIEQGQFKDTKHKYGELQQLAKNANSARALFVFSGLEGKMAELKGDFQTAEKYYLDQLGYCNHPAVRSDEKRAQVYTDIARNAYALQKIAVAKEFLEMAQRCQRKYAATQVALTNLQKEISKEKEKQAES